MKKLMLWAAMAAFTLVSCDKDEDEAQSNSGLIVGTWESSSYLEVQKNSNGIVTDTLQYYTAGDSVTAVFTSSGIATLDFGGFPIPGTYGVSGNTLTLISGQDTVAFQLNTLTGTLMVWSGTEVDSNVTYETQATFVKQ